MAEVLTRSEYDLVLAALLRIGACRDPRAMPAVVAREVRALVNADRVGFEHIAPTVPRMWGVAEPEMTYTPDRWRILAEHRDEHPCLAHHAKTGDPHATKISDFLTVAQWHRTTLYQHLHRWIDCEDQMGCVLDVPGEPFHGLALYRDRRGFTERDRRILNLLRPHVGQAYQTALLVHRLERARRRWDGIAAALGLATLSVSRTGLIRQADPPAMDALQRFFRRAGQADRLPPPVRDWLEANWPGTAAPPGGRAADRAPMVRQRDGQMLLLRVLPAESGDPDTATLLIERRTMAQHAPRLREKGLTRREIEVLSHVEQGRNNEEVAAALHISPETVRKHLENIFGKLGVTNRTAAVAVARADHPAL